MPYTVEHLERSRNIGFRPKKLFGMLLKEFIGAEDGCKIIDLGCGTGFFTRILAEQFKNSEVVGMDIDEELLKGATDISRSENLNIKYEVGDITNINYEDNTFDVVVSDIMLECFEDTTVPLKEMKRICKPGGVIVSIEPFYQNNFSYFPEVKDKYIRDTLLKWDREGRDYGLGPMLPEYFNSIGLRNIDMINWFWGTIGYQSLEYISINEKLQSIKNEIEVIKRILLSQKGFTEDEKKIIIDFYTERMEKTAKNPEILKSDMSVAGLPVFITKGNKAVSKNN